MDLGAKLYELRKEKRLSQEEEANLLGVTRQTVSKWETNQSTPDFDKIVPLCELYGIMPNELFGKGTAVQEDNSPPVPSFEQPAETENSYIMNDDGGNHSVFIESHNEENAEKRRKKAICVAVSVMIFVLGICWLMVSIPVLKINPIVSSAIFLLIIAVGVGVIIFSSMVFKEENQEQQPLTKEQKIQKQISEITAAAVLVIYLLISFLTGAWHITWILWVVYAIIKQIIKLIFILKGDGNEEE